jgi:hypothetical protein
MEFLLVKNILKVFKLYFFAFDHLLLEFKYLFCDKVCGILNFFLWIKSECDHEARRLILAAEARNLEFLPDLVAQFLEN